MSGRSPVPSSGESRPRILPTLVVGGIGLVIAFVVIGWVIGTIFAILRLALIVVVAIAVIAAIASARADR